uniref:Alpha-amylase n=1 Tax=Toxocara canis TaxID=6265 RepID=A0A183V278_TOXCA
LHYITNDWNMDGTDGLRISGTVSGVDDLFGGFLPENFVKTKDDWANEIVRIKSYLSTFYAGQTTSPISDDSGINAALSQQTPWLHCSLAKSQSIFMVAINGGSLNLAKLALPSKELFIDMGDFKEVPMSSLVNKIILTTCECATQQDGTLPAGCPLSESVIH